uniref:Tetraspanin-9 n=1 Tax=Oncorhynchus mykiss TaxID=8022 RepID=A0A8L0DRV5_ONCMY
MSRVMTLMYLYFILPLSVGGLWFVGCGGVVVCVSGQFCHPITILPLHLCCQPHHHPGCCHHGYRLPGLPGCHQGEQVSAAEFFHHVVGYSVGGADPTHPVLRIHRQCKTPIEPPVNSTPGYPSSYGSCTHSASAYISHDPLCVQVSDNARQDLQEGLALYSTNNNAGLRNAWNTIQTEWHCCGVNGYTDWHTALQEKVVPDHCCQDIYQDCGRNATNQFWTRGCYEKVEEWLDDNKHLLGTIAMCVLVIQLLGMAFSMTLYQQIHRSGKKYEA